MYLSSSIQIVTWHLQLEMTRVMSKRVLQTFKQGSCTCFELNLFSFHCMKIAVLELYLV